MRNILFITTLLFSQFLVAQEYPKEFGRVTHDEIEMTSYSKDKKAEALILFNIGKSTFIEAKGGYNISFHHKKRIKIFERSAIELSEISIPFYVDGYGSSESVYSIEAYTYNLEDGRIMRKSLDQATIYEEKINKHWRVKKFAFPDVKEGSIIEYSYVLESPFHFNLPDWDFQDIIPTLYSECQVSMIPFYEYVFIVQGVTKFDYQHSEVGKKTRTWGTVSNTYGRNVGPGVEFKDYIHTYVMKDVPAFKDESYITSIEDYIIKMDFQLAKVKTPHSEAIEIITTWPKFNESILKLDEFGKYLKGCKKYAKSILETEKIDGLPKNQKVDAIINYVRENFSWNGINSKYASNSPKETINQKSGNSADINLLLVSLLVQAGFDSYPVLLSTRQHGKIKLDYPFRHYFNYVLAYIKDDPAQLADGTTKYLSTSMIPISCINDKGLIINKDEVNWIELSNSQISENVKQIILDIDVDEIIANAKVTVQTTLYEATRHKDQFKNNETSIIETVEEKYLDKVNRLKTVNFNKPNAPYIISFEGEMEIEVLGDNVVINPFLNFEPKESKLKQKTRDYPVDLVYPISKEYNIIINIPDGYKAGELPENYSMNNNIASINVEYFIKGNSVNIKGKYVLKKAIYETDEYSKIKYYLLMISKKFNDHVILEKL